MIIAVDIDEVLASLFEKFLEYYNKKHNTSFEFKNIHNYNFWKVMNISEEKGINSVLDFYLSEEFMKITPVKDSVESITKLAKNHELHLITARPESTKENTKKWVLKNFPDVFRSITHCDFTSETHKKKAQVCQEIKADILIEDSAKYANSSAKKGVKVFLINQSWNMKEKLEKNVTRVDGWNEIVKKII